jgi:carboxylesterase
LIHGLTGTPFEMRFLGGRIAEAGIRVSGIRLAGHAASPQALGDTGHEHWYESVVSAFEQLRGYGDPNVVIGLSLGAVLSARLALDWREDVAGIVMLAPAFFLARSATAALSATRLLGPLSRRVYLNSKGSDIHDQAARSIHPSSRRMPLSAPISLVKLSRMVRRRLPRLNQPALIIHSRNDHTCPYSRNVEFLMKRLGSRHKRLVELSQSHHVITVDTEKERVVAEVAGFLEQFRGVNRSQAAI